MEELFVETKVESLEGNKVKVTVTVDAADIDGRIKKTYKDFARKYNFPGFRKARPRARLSTTPSAPRRSSAPSPRSC